MMIQAYCPGYEDSRRWDPVLHEWFSKHSAHVAPLFPYGQQNSMDAISGKGSIDEIFTPLNGLFLHTNVEKALDNGWIAIVPDVNLTRSDCEDKQQGAGERLARHNDIKEWQAQGSRKYKVVVIAENNSNDLDKKYFWNTKLADEGIDCLRSLDGRKLVFQTEFRPRARYLWWTFASALIKAAWTQKKKDEKNVLAQEILKTNLYWGTQGRYVKDSMLMAMVEELG